MDEVDKLAFSMHDWREGSSEAFRKLFFLYYPEFHSFAYSLLTDKPSSVNSATEAFFLLWRKREYLDSEKDIKAFLYNTIRNSCLNYLKYKQQYPDTGIYLPQIRMDPSFPEETLQELLAYVARETETR
jgi:DNA-directed RNA polymerase specialized sigma24 family protein